MPFCELHYFSAALGKQTTASVLLPDPNIKGPYHTMLLLHGLSDNQTMWMRKTSIERYVEGLPLIVVMPDGGRGFYCDAEEGFKYYTAIAEELPAVISHYFAPKGKWAVAGLSMGGYGAFRLALSRPDFFSAAVSLSGALYFGREPYRKDDDFGREFSRIVGPNPKNGPNDLFSLALKNKKLPALQFLCGSSDFLLNSNTAFHQHLLDNKIPHEYTENTGDHNWEYWDEHIQGAIKFIRKNLEF